MPLSVTERRAAVRQFVAERRGRPEDKRLEGPQIRATPPEVVLSRSGEEVAGRRQAALQRVRQRRAERAMECARERDDAIEAMTGNRVDAQESGNPYPCDAPCEPFDAARVNPACPDRKEVLQTALQRKSLRPAGPLEPEPPEPSGPKASLRCPEPRGPEPAAPAPEAQASLAAGDLLEDPPCMV
ncbi:unnamed protein product [Effrenium voratum]|nr:unnamed protein product [Effrenium voratum]